MQLLSRKADYALLILSHLDRHREGGSAREVAEQFGLSHSFVANILKVLTHKGFVVSHRGVKGGYVLARPTEQIRLIELLDAVDEPVHLAECNRTSPDEHCTLTAVCPLRHAIADVHRRIREVLSNVTLAELFRPAQITDLAQMGVILGPIMSKQLLAP
jgi:Rrf2 family protein